MSLTYLFPTPQQGAQSYVFYFGTAAFVQVAEGSPHFAVHPPEVPLFVFARGKQAFLDNPLERGHAVALLV